MGTADRNVLRARFRHGEEEFLVGGHPLWQVLRGVFQMKNRPLFIGGLSLIAGYASAWAMRKTEPGASRELREFHRREQIERLRRADLQPSSAWPNHERPVAYRRWRAQRDSGGPGVVGSGLL